MTVETTDQDEELFAAFQARFPSQPPTPDMLETMRRFREWKRMNSSTQPDSQTTEDDRGLLARLVQQEHEIEVMRTALLRIAFDHSLSSLTADPSRWPFYIAYTALGGRIVDGVQIDLQRLAEEAKPHCAETRDD